MIMISSAAGVTLAEKIGAAQARVVVIGLGYVGLPLAAAFAEAGLTTVGLEIDDRKAGSVMEGVSYIDDVAGDTLARQVAAGSLRATTDPGVLAEADVAIICVPTPYSKTKQPDLTCISQAAGIVGEHLHPGMLVILESTDRKSVV